MDTFDDLNDVAMLDLDATATELLIAGALEVDDAPPGFECVARLIHKAQGPATAEEYGARVATVSRFADTARARRFAGAKTKRGWAIPAFAAKVMALAVPVVLLGGTVAVATNSLPRSTQAAVARALSSVGISAPKPQNASSGTKGSSFASSGSGAATAKGLGIGPGIRATGGLCRAWRAGNINQPSTAFNELVAAAGGASLVPAYCARSSASSTPHETARAQEPAPRQPQRGRKAAKALATGHHQAPVTRGTHSQLAAGLLRHRGTHRATTPTAGSISHRSSPTAGRCEPTASNTPTQGKSGTASGVESSFVISSASPGCNSVRRHGPKKQAPVCTASSQTGQVTQIRPHCRPVTTTGSNTNTLPTNTLPTAPGHHHLRTHRPSSVGSTPRSVKSPRRVTNRSARAIRR